MEELMNEFKNTLVIEEGSFLVVSEEKWTKFNGTK